MIYGAQGAAIATYKALISNNLSIDILGFLVTNLEKNPQTIKGLPVYELAVYANKLTSIEKENLQIWIATSDFVMDQIENELRKFNLKNIKRIDSIILEQLQVAEFKNNQSLVPLHNYNTKPLTHRGNLQVFQTKFQGDRDVKNSYASYDYLYPLQVGASLTSVRVADLIDCTGKHISQKNGDYCELTGLYWIWQNIVRQDKEKLNNYYGLNHYRRIFELSTEDIQKIFSNNIDVVLPFPLSYDPNMICHRQRCVSDFEWAATLQALNELYPNEMDEYQSVLNQELIFNYNIFIARGDVLEEYCSWLFPILRRVEELVNPDGTRPANRYVGYIAESLETIYFLSKKDKLKIACQGCRLLT